MNWCIEVNVMDGLKKIVAIFALMAVLAAVSAPAMAQGSSRLARGQAWTSYVNGQFGARHKAVVAPACGHNARCMFTSDTALPVLFPKQ
jgi:hypothetical protein